MDKTELLEKIAEIQHDAWMEWSKAVASEVSPERKARWESFWVPYDQLEEPTKDLDREWAQEIMDIIEPDLQGQGGKVKEVVTRSLASGKFPTLKKVLGE